MKTLDLHGCTADEVADKVDQFLLKASRNGTTHRVKIMTGKGKGIVQKIVVDYLKQAGYPWQYEKTSSGQTNTGIMVIFLD